ncbi:hypothetical protein WJU23_15240 [Prosthecobacter sp. SYSU 5D2]
METEADTPPKIQAKLDEAAHGTFMEGSRASIELIIARSGGETSTNASEK